MADFWLLLGQLMVVQNRALGELTDYGIYVSDLDKMRQAITVVVDRMYAIESAKEK